MCIRCLDDNFPLTLGFLCHNFHPYAFRRPFSNPRPSFPFSANCSCLQRTLYWDVGTGDFYATKKGADIVGALRQSDVCNIYRFAFAFM